MEKNRLWLLPKRRHLHQQMSKFLAMLDDVIEAKRKLIKKGVFHNEDLEENEKDLLTLMTESENRDERRLSDEELKVFFH